METTEYLGLKLPSRDGDDIADINVISDDFKKVENKIEENEEAIIKNKEDISKNKSDINVISVDLKKAENKIKENEEAIGERMTIAEAEYTYEKKENKSTSMDMQSNITYPTTRAVADFVKKKTSVLSNALYNSKKGAIISLNDISPVSSDVDIQLENSVTPTMDFSNVNVKIGGKNLFVDFITDQTTTGGSTITVNGDGSVTVVGVAGDAISQQYALGRIPKGTYTISNGLTTGTLPRLTCVFRKLGTNDYIHEIGTGNASSQTITLKEDCNATLMLYGAKISAETFTLYPQLEYSSVATEYEQYIDIFEMNPESDGKLSIATNFPNLTIFTDTDNVVVNAKYQRDINKAFEELQNAIISLGGNI